MAIYESSIEDSDEAIDSNELIETGIAVKLILDAVGAEWQDKPQANGLVISRRKDEIPLADGSSIKFEETIIGDEQKFRIVKNSLGETTSWEWSAVNRNIQIWQKSLWMRKEDVQDTVDDDEPLILHDIKGRGFSRGIKANVDTSITDVLDQLGDETDTQELEAGFLEDAGSKEPDMERILRFPWLEAAMRADHFRRQGLDDVAVAKLIRRLVGEGLDEESAMAAINEAEDRFINTVIRAPIDSEESS